MSAQAGSWRSQRERASPFWLNLIAWTAHTLGRGVARLVLVPVATYYFLTGHEARAASREFLTRALGRPPARREVWRHFYTFAAVTLDRLYARATGSSAISVSLKRVDEALAMVRAGRCLVLVAHFGSFEALLKPAVERFGLPVRFVLDRAHAQMLMQLLERVHPGLSQSVIDASSGGPSLVLALKEALEQGSIVGLMADRIREGERALSVQFMGGTALLPALPWILAGTLGVPVMLAFCAYRGGNSYEAYFEPFAQKVTLPRQDRERALQEYAQRYAESLERHARAAPYNWFNFYDFWRK
jgi:predicted LPLAT superfamily acyltransferase